MWETIILLHGYPASSRMFREQIPLLADRFRVIAPDMVGFSHSDAPAIDRFDYTFTEMMPRTGPRRPAALNPDAWTFDQTLLDRPGMSDIQLGEA